MTHTRRILITLGVIALLLLTFGAAAAKGHDKPQPPHGGAGLPQGQGRPARLTWTPGRLIQVVTAGQTVHVTATFISSADITEATLVIPGQLGKVMQADTAKLTNITAGTVTTVTFTVTMPTQRAHTQSGVVLVRVGQRVLAQSLKVRLSVTSVGGAGHADTTQS